MLLLAGSIAVHAQSGTQVREFATPAPILASPTVSPDGVTYLGSYDRKIYALAATGEVLWVTPLPPPDYIYFAVYAGIYGTPALGVDGTVYIPSENGKLLALDPANGAVKWTYAPAQVEGLYSSPAVAADGTIYFGSYDRNLYAINPDGSRKWSSRFDSTIFASPAVGHDGTVYCGSDDGTFYALNPANGLRRWTFNTGSYAITASPAIATDGTLYLGVGSIHNPTFYSIDPAGTTNWVFTVGSRVRSSAAIGPNGTVYFGCDDGKLYALNPDGTQRWAFPAGGPVGSSPAIAADGTIYFGCDDGKLYAVDPDGNELWSFRTGDYVFTSPVVSPDGTIYFASADGKLYGLRGCNPPAVSAWPMFRQNMSRTGLAAGATTNRPPVLESIPDQLLTTGQALVLTNSATDPDLGQQLVFSLGIGAPAGATIDAAIGRFEWTPTGFDAGRVHFITIVVTDNGTPRLSSTQCFSATVDSGSGTLLEVTPAEGLSSSGPLGGPFDPPSIIYTLTNSGASTLDWTASAAQNWVTLSATSGTLTAGAATTVTVSINTTADTLAAGGYNDSVSFANTTTGDGNSSRTVSLAIWQHPILTITRSSDPAGWIIQVDGEPNQTVTIQASEDLLAWDVVHTEDSGVGGQVDYFDAPPIPGADRRFYRAWDEAAE